MADLLGTFEWTEHDVVRQITLYHTRREGFELWYRPSPGHCHGPLWGELPNDAARWLMLRLRDALEPSTPPQEALPVAD